MSLVYLSAFLSLFSVASCRPQDVSLIKPTDGPDISDTICGDIVVQHEQGYSLFWASDVFECLSNIPFIPDVATRFLNYYNQTLQFQSTLAYLKTPPEGYQQPPVDVLAELQAIQDKVDSGYYTGEYLFESELQILINRMHDAHVYLSAGALAPFAYVSPYGLVSASPDGKQTPAIYLQSDVVSSRDEGWTPSPITQINGQDIVDYLTGFAELNSEGNLEPHADWNALMEHPTRDIQGGLSVLQSATFYPGDELNFEFANGTEIPTYWLATYSELENTGPLTTAGDFYNYFVLGLLPDSFDENNASSWVPPPPPEDDSGEDTEKPPTYGCNAKNLSWCLESAGAFPDTPDVIQEDLKVTGGGIITGYFLDDISTGVISLPSFYQTGNDTETFFAAVDEFIKDAEAKNTERIIIDLQQNTGGLTLLALSVFKRFFFGMDPYTGSRIRSHEYANILGATYTKWWNELEEKPEDDESLELYYYFAGSEWVATNRINPATGANFTSWAEYYGPLTENGDQFSQTQLFNLSDTVFDASSFEGYVPFGYDENSAAADFPNQHWAPENIVLLTDGLCSSACAYFVELMNHQAGVKTVVVGGRPVTGPMQTASGTRGARLYSAESLDYDIINVNYTLENEEAAARLPARDEESVDTGIWVNFAGINIRDQVRDNDSVPIQFKYEAAECRLFYTLDNVYNLTRLWRDVAKAAWDDTSLCVEDSTGYAPVRNAPTPKSPPPRTAQAPNLDLVKLGYVGNVDPNVNATIDHLNGVARQSLSAKDLIPCPAKGPCPGSTQCEQVTVTCRDAKKTKKELSVCVPKCSNAGVKCTGDLECVPQIASESKNQRLPPRRGSTAGTPALGKFSNYEGVQFYNGYCEPRNPDPRKFPKLGCPL